MIPEVEDFLIFYFVFYTFDLILDCDLHSLVIRRVKFQKKWLRGMIFEASDVIKRNIIIPLKILKGNEERSLGRFWGPNIY